jgi:nucleoside-diphosphate-sugar epimerase
MKLLITGASGFIGRNLLLNVPDLWEVTAVYNNSKDFIPYIIEKGLRLTPAKIDFLDEDQVTTLAKANNHFDCCIYLAANGDPAVSAERPDYDLKSNVLSLVNLVNRISFDKFVYFSSGAVYDGLQGGVSPVSTLDPKLPYAISKLAAEGYVKFFQKQQRIKDFAIVRFFGAYGPHEPPRKIYTRLVRRFAIERDPDFTIRGTGENLIDAMYVDDAIKAIRLLAEDDRPLNRVIDLYSGSPLSITELVRKSAQIFGLEARLHYEGYVPEYIEFHSCDDFMRKAFDFAPAIDLEVGLHHLLGQLRIDDEKRAIHA